MGVTKAYLTLYNVVNAASWSYVLLLTADCARQNRTAKQLWKTISAPLKFAQTLAVLEILHSLVKLVKSPVLSTLLQVLSRIIVLWGWTNASPSSQSHWSLYMMVTSWALVEVPRYAFYAVNLVQGSVPYPLLWLRYSLFAILYPSGISGEVLQIKAAMDEAAEKPEKKWVYYLASLLLASYVPGSPFMYRHMLTQRAKALK